ncbi:hypothetical protein DV704_10960 [Meiothermus sp. QL-1]|nr:hypothetical protein DV704_10960 [Meiothermus sp. QL-1]
MGRGGWVLGGVGRGGGGGGGGAAWGCEGGCLSPGSGISSGSKSRGSCCPRRRRPWRAGRMIKKNRNKSPRISSKPILLS